MRRGVAVLFACSLMMAGCGRAADSSATISAIAPSADTSKDESSSDRRLIVYFSLAGEQYGVGTVSEGNTAIVADMIAEKTGADTFEIVAENSYPTDLKSLFEVAKEEQDSDALPDYVGDVKNWDDYSTIYLGYPLWYDTLPGIVVHFLEDHDFSGKTIYPFNTSGGEGLLDTVNTIKSIARNGDVRDGLTIRGTDAQNNRETAEEAVDAWLKEADQ